jgi:hypothetical protein
MTTRGSSALLQLLAVLLLAKLGRVDHVAGRHVGQRHSHGNMCAGHARLAFDQNQILSDGVERAKAAKLEYTPLAAAFSPRSSPLPNCATSTRAVWGEELDPRNFHRNVTRIAGFLVDTGCSVSEGPGRPPCSGAAASKPLPHHFCANPTRPRPYSERARTRGPAARKSTVAQVRHGRQASAIASNCT